MDLAGNNEKKSGQSLIGSTDWKDEDSVADCANALWNLRDWKMDVEKEAYRNIEFAANKQWIKYSKNLKKWTTPDDRDPYDVQLTFNLIAGQLRQKLAKLIRNNPVWDVTPATEDQEDREVARLGTQVLGSYYTTILKMPQVLRRVLMWAMTTKVCFLEVGWDKNLGDPVSVTPDDLLGVMDEGYGPAQQAFAGLYGDQAAQMGQQNTFTGDIYVDVAPLFEVNVWPFSILDWSEAEIWMRTKQMTVHEAADAAGLTVDQVREFATPPQDRQDWYKSSGARWSVSNSSTVNAQDSQSDTVLWHRLYRKKCRSYPEGVFAEVLGRKTVRLGPNPTPGARIPILPFQEEHTAGSLWGTCTVDRLISPQIELNLASSQEANYRNKSAKPTAVEYVGGIVSGRLTNQPGARIKCSSKDRAPEYLNPPPCNIDYDRTIQRAIGMIHDIGGVSAVDLGNPSDADVKSGVAIARLQEQTEASLIPFGMGVDEQMSECGSIILELLQHNLNDERMAHLVGETNSYEVVKFSGINLRPSTFGQPGQKTAVVSVNSFRKLPSSKAELRQMFSQFTGNWLDPTKPEDKRMFWSAWGLGDTRQAEDRDRLDEAAEEAEIDMWRQGRLDVPTPSKTEKHDVRFEVLNKWMNTGEYKQLAATNQQLHNAVSEHRLLHEQGMADNMVRPQYLLKDSDIRQWMEARSKWMERAAQAMEAGDAKAAQMFMEIANAFYQVPLGTAPSMPVDDGGGSPPPSHNGNGNGSAPKNAQKGVDVGAGRL